MTNPLTEWTDALERDIISHDERLKRLDADHLGLRTRIFALEISAKERT